MSQDELFKHVKESTKLKWLDLHSKEVEIKPTPIGVKVSFRGTEIEREKISLCLDELVEMPA